MASAERKASAGLTRLRVAQACREPVDVDRIVELLAGDELAHDLSAEKVQAQLDEFVASGLIDELPRDRYILAGVLRSDYERRLVGSLREPTSLRSLQRMLEDDPQAPVGTEGETRKLLDDLIKRGLVVGLGEHADGKSALKAHKEHPETPDLPGEHAKEFAGWIDLPERRWRLNGELYGLTNLALDALSI